MIEKLQIKEFVLAQPLFLMLMEVFLVFLLLVD